MGKDGGNKKEWTDEEVMELIHLYEAEEFLWNVKHKCYRNRDKKMSTFDEFAKQFNCDGNEVQRKIHNLRNQVSHKMQKMKELKSGDGEENRYESKWKFFSALKFIMPSFTPTQSTSNIQVTATEDSPGVPEDEPTDEPTPKRIKPPAKKVSRTPEDDIVQEAIDIMKKPKDDFDCFGDYVAMELRNIKSDYYREQLKSAIRKAIVQFSDMDEQSYWNSGPSSSTSSAVHSRSPTPTTNVVHNNPLLESFCDTQTAQQYYNSLYNNL